MVVNQLPLAMTPRLPFEADEFIEHAGVSFITHRARELFCRDGFHILFINGAQGSGKSHLSVKLAAVSEGLGREYILTEGSLLSSSFPSPSQASVFIIDDSHSYLETLVPGRSGPLVTFIEALRIQNSKLVFLSALTDDQFQYDEHLQSRIAQAFRFEISQPDERDKLTLIAAMARQRGLFLSPKKLAFLEARLSRDVSAIASYLDRVLELSASLGTPVHFQLLQGAL